MRHTIVSVASSLLLLPFTQGRSLPRLIPRGDAGISGHNYQGCYTEATTGRALTGGAFFNDLMTVEKCAASCSAFAYFGVEYGRECYCGNSLSAGSVNAAETDCSFSCPGNSAETCGAGNRLNLYQKPVSPPASMPTSYASEGCYTEPSNGRALTGKTIFDDSLTIDRCAQACAGFNYFGLEYYRECYCGNDLQDGSVPAPSTDCKYPCAGDSSEICGGDYRLNLYGFGGISPSSTTTAAASATPSPSNFVSTGCYTEATNSRALTGAAYYDDQMTTEECAAVCTGFTYFGTEYARECYCGNTFQAGSVPAPASDCSTPCPGNKAEKCGGGNRLNVYEFNSAISSTTSMSSSSASSSGMTSTSIMAATTTSSVMVPETTSTSMASTIDTPTTSSIIQTVSTSSTSTAAPDTTTSTSQSTTSTMDSSMSSSTPSVVSSSTVSSSTITSTSSSSTLSSNSVSSSTSVMTSSSTSSVITSTIGIATVSPTSSSTTTSSSRSSSTSIMTSSSTSSSTTTSTTTSTTATPTATSGNLLKNGGFEAAKAADVAWTTFDQDGGVTVNFMAKKDSTTAPHGGAQQLSIAFNIVGGKNDETFGQTFTATRATNYQFSIYTFSPIGGDKCKWDFYISDSSRATTIATTSLKYKANDAALGNYVQTTLAFNSGTNTALAAYATLDCTAYKPGTALTFYADDVSVTPA